MTADTHRMANITTITRTNTKTAEFAKLFELFDRVATRRSRGDVGIAIGREDIAAIPPEFAPVLKNLSTLLSIRAQRNQDRQIKPTGRPRRNTVGAGVAEELPSFPPEDRYPFTFKLMLHKLYDIGAWAEKVKSTVEASKEQFKPLAERIQEFSEENTRQLKKGVTRARSHSVIGAPKSPRAALGRVVPAEPSRALKKRCVGRRKSMSGPMAGAGWVYDAAVSSVEVSPPRSAMVMVFNHPSDIAVIPETRSRHQSLAGLEGIGARDAARRKTKIVDTSARFIGQERGSRTVTWSLDSPRTRLSAAEIISKRRGISWVAENDTTEGLKRVAVKRRLSS
ncbi:hypothetical protein BJ138DRAFT_1153272 [Hygrophoropsis aurantiaca]|uniref:Uncharacterized protein n=1 Tax=Hygrophoropsis aurantiaca TaxID=72124 RepID=A0ACB8AC17_9AGAM|nr:hypothetical protein BJ138DRAFT_1153272 [Hygrophoropsis aurantiaca]